MMNWSGCSIFSNRFLKLSVVLFFAATVAGNGQSLSHSLTRSTSSLRSQGYAAPEFTDTTTVKKTYPDPHQVLYKSLIIPGWGQVINKQIWKVPIVYALLGGLTGYSIYLTKEYHDYRAAYYNLNSQTVKDGRFGPTPAYLQNANLSALRTNRNSLHNRRDFMYVTIALAYGLNAIDAYVFANLRTFDVSNDLSVRTTIKPHILARSIPAITFSFQLFKKSNAESL